MQIFFMYQYFIQGIIRKPEERMYWTTKEIFATPIFPKLITLRRYLYRICRHEKYDPHTHPNPKLNKIWPVKLYIKTFPHYTLYLKKLHIPEKDISVDESYCTKIDWNLVHRL